MGMKRPRVLAMYKAASMTPSAETDQRILAMARQRRDSITRAPRYFATATAVVLVAVFVARWMMPGSTDITYTNFGLEEGQARAWLTTYQPTLTATGPGSREGLPQ